MWQFRGRRGGRGKTRGVTLAEVLVASSITALMAGASMPAMLYNIQRYRADAAPRQVMADLRFAQSHAIARGMEARVVIFNNAGQATGAGYTDASKANQYRVEARPTGGAWPALGDTMMSNLNVLTPWTDLGHDYRQAVTQANVVAFTSRGALLGGAASLDLVLQTAPAGTSRTVRTSPSGNVEIL